jgi:predicted ATP-grasp superfamily ATP-dependent carboligase
MNESVEFKSLLARALEGGESIRTSVNDRHTDVTFDGKQAVYLVEGSPVPAEVYRDIVATRAVDCIEWIAQQLEEIVGAIKLRNISSNS